MSLFRDYDGKVTPEEVAAAAVFLKDSLDKESVHELIASLAKDSGIIYLFIFLWILGSLFNFTITRLVSIYHGYPLLFSVRAVLMLAQLLLFTLSFF